MILIPSKKLPSPSVESPRIGTSIPMINKPIPFKVSEIATARRPPKTAYMAPRQPTAIIVMTNP